MPWFKVDDHFHAHPKVLALRTGQYEAEALSVWAKAGSWCMANLTDGAVPTYVVDTLLKRNALKGADELVRVRLWEKTEDGYRFRKWDEYQPSKDAVVTKRKKNANKVASWRERNQSQPERNQVTDAHVTLPPTRPDPTHTQESAAHSPHAPVAPKSENGRRAEALRAGYAERFPRAFPGLRLPATAQPMSGGPWLDIARELDDGQVAPLLDAFFADADPFTRDKAPTKILSQRVRLLAASPGPSQTQPAMSPERQALSAAKEALDRDPLNDDLRAAHKAAQAAVRRAEARPGVPS